MRLIVVPVSSGAASANAARYAADMALAIGAGLRLVNVNQEIRFKEYCEREKPFLIVMGAEEHETMMQSSNTTKTMHRLPYPVLSIPENAVFQGVRKIVVACDLEDIFSGMPAVLPFLKELSGLLGAHFEVVHVARDGERSAEEVRMEYNRWQKEVAAFEPEMHYIRKSNVEEGINRFLEGQRADWLLVLPKKHALIQFHKSRAKQIVLQCAMPVMSVHE